MLVIGGGGGVSHRMNNIHGLKSSVSLFGIDILNSLHI